MRTVGFHRNFQRFRGGHLKVFHYFEHVRSSPSYDAWIRFTPDSVWDASNPWSGLRDAVIDSGDAAPPADILFLAGMDWRWLEPEDRVASRLPIINLIQGVRHTGPSSGLRPLLAHPAIRICVCTEIQELVEDVGSVEGPIFTIPIGIDLERLPAPRAAEGRDIDCVVQAIKDRPLGASIAKRLAAANYRVLLVDQPIPRDELLEATARARVAVHLPLPIEGAHLPPLESMALGALVVCPDCLGNRSYCRDGETCLVPERSENAIVESALMALTASSDELAPMLAAAHEESMGRSLDVERNSFLEILDRADELWAG
jgi:hypothetical protein